MGNRRLNIGKAVAEICLLVTILGVTYWGIWWFLDRVFALPSEIVSVLFIVSIAGVAPGAVIGFREWWQKEYVTAAAEASIRPSRLRPLLIQAAAGLVFAIGAAYTLWLGIYTAGAILILLTGVLTGVFAGYGFLSLTAAIRRTPTQSSPTVDRWLHWGVLWIPVGLVAAVALVRLAIGDADTAAPVLLFLPLLGIMLWVVRLVTWR